MRNIFFVRLVSSVVNFIFGSASPHDIHEARQPFANANQPGSGSRHSNSCQHRGRHALELKHAFGRAHHDAASQQAEPKGRERIYVPVHAKPAGQGDLSIPLASPREEILLLHEGRTRHSVRSGGERGRSRARGRHHLHGHRRGRAHPERRLGRAGTHVNVVGSGFAGPAEIDTDLVARSRFFVDSREGVLAQGAEFLRAKEAGVIDDTHIASEIGEVLAGIVTDRTSDDEITIYKSLGHIVQDLAGAWALYAGRV